MSKNKSFMTIVCKCGQEFTVPDKGFNPFLKHKEDTGHSMEVCTWRGVISMVKKDGEKDE
jgi:hypothetical protein